MIENLLKSKVLVALLVTLTAPIAVADDSWCRFYPKMAGPLESYIPPQSSEYQVAHELIDRLTPSEIAAEKPISLVQDNIELAGDGRNFWTIRELRPGRMAMVFASTRAPSPSRLGKQWHQDFHRALTKVLQESLRRGIEIEIVTQGKCD